ncbi:DNA-formamidopyrimidine glycosylase [Lyngbya aestuarii]|uniref:DNA-formamidopyrimidine glycosylase n=1 Tax=Lyngbya aestuarii TaxID=118322 RepID=UPI00403E3333
MPELPEVETVRLGLNQVTLAQEIRGGEVLLSRSIAYPFSADQFLVGLNNVTIIDWQRRGKYLLAKLTAPDRSDAGWLGVHLRMTGQLLWLNQDEPLQKHTRVRLFFTQSRELRFVDTRTFGKMWWVPPSQPPESIIAGLQKLGPEPFSAEFSPDYLTKKLRNRQRAIKTLLLDQGIVAGVGNIYADEALFLSGIRPETLGAVLNLEQIEGLYRAIIKVLQTSIESGGTTFSSFLNVLGVNGNYGGVAWVYGRTGEPCRICSTPIERLKLAGRSSHFCPQCQH